MSERLDEGFFFWYSEFFLAPGGIVMTDEIHNLRFFFDETEKRPCL